MTACAIVAALEFDEATFERLRGSAAFSFLIAADAGVARLEALGLSADLIVGDFDSLGYTPQGAHVVRHPVHKDASDLELAIEEAVARGFDAAFVFGALGGRLDHTIAALHTCARFAESGMDMVMVGEDFAVKILVGPGSYDIPQLESGTVSVFSATDLSTGVTEKGLEYPLENAQLRNRTTLGLSNELAGKPASVSVERGTLYIFHPLPSWVSEGV